MFKFLKEKLSKALDVFKEKAEEEIEEPKEEIKEKVQVKIERKKEEKKEEKSLEKEIKEEPKKEEKISFIQKIKEKVTTKVIDEEKFEEMFWDLELVLMENNVAVEVIEKIKEDLKMDIVNVPIKRNEVSEIVERTLRKSLEDLLNFEEFNLVEKIKNNDEKPFVIVFFGINGSGKTTTIAKVANLLKNQGLSCVLVAGDTWRKAAIEQIEDWADKLNIKLIKGQYGADPAAIGFDAVAYAKKNKIDVVLMDTAGRQHANVNLMDELKKINRVVKPNLKIFIGESITGNDAVNQAKEFDKAVGIDGIILTKFDADEKGGAVISVSYVTLKPIIYLGNGQNASDLKNFNKEEVIEAILA